MLKRRVMKSVKRSRKEAPRVSSDGSDLEDDFPGKNRVVKNVKRLRKGDSHVSADASDSDEEFARKDRAIKKVKKSRKNAPVSEDDWGSADEDIANYRVIKNAKKSWDKVGVDSAGASNDPEWDFADLVGFEELTDYAVVDGKLVKKTNSTIEDNKPKKKITVKSNVKKKQVKADSMLEDGNKLTHEPTKKLNDQKSQTKKKKKKKKNHAAKGTESSRDAKSTEEEAKLKCSAASKSEEEVSQDVVTDMTAWNGLGVPFVLLRALHENSFTTPTTIQALTLPSAIFGRQDILGAAETGSGKTLAFGLPILNGILQAIEEGKDSDKNTTETSVALGNREVDSDEVDSDQDMSEDASDEGSDEFDNNEEMDNEDDNDFDSQPRIVRAIDNIPEVTPSVFKKSNYSAKPLYALVLTPTRELAVQISQHLKAAAKYTSVSVAVIVGGLASQKQTRVLNGGPEIVVATPGRLWDLIEGGHPHLSDLHKLKYLAIDETDRMLESGHFEELGKILKKVNGDKENRTKRQNFIFSATLALTHEPPKYLFKKEKKDRNPPKQLTSTQKLAIIMHKVGLTNPKIVDITSSSGVADRLLEAEIICSRKEKDHYLYYFLQRHPGRTLVFCNSIDCVRRLTHLFSLLQCSPLPLHAKMVQKQRLKNLERFRDNPKGVLLATDVAARGLDIPNVRHVIHYQTPRTAENYVHRSGRTARAQQEGLTVLFVEPAEVSKLAHIFQTLGRDSNLPSFPVEGSWLASVKERINLAQQLDQAELRAQRANDEQGQFDKLVKEMDIIISDEELPTSYSREGTGKLKKQAAVLRQQFDALMKKPIIPKELAQKGNFVVPSCQVPTVNKNIYQENAVEALKSAVEERTSLKRKRNQERSKQSTRKRKWRK